MQLEALHLQRSHLIGCVEDFYFFSHRLCNVCNTSHFFSIIINEKKTVVKVLLFIYGGLNSVPFYYSR